MQTGVDIVKIDRLKSYENDEKFLNKYFTKTEIEYLSKKHNKLETLAGLYACKEAVLKALGIGISRGLELKEICISHTSLGMPFVEVDAKIMFHLNNIGAKEISVSISHDGEYAIAFCVCA